MDYKLEMEQYPIATFAIIATPVSAFDEVKTEKTAVKMFVQVEELIVWYLH